MSYQIRQAMVSDIDSLSVELEKFSDQYSTKLPPYKDKETSERVLKLMIEEHLFYVAVDDSMEIVGFIAGFVHKHIYNPDIKTLCEAFWWTKKEHRRSGVGIQLLEAFESWGKKNVDWILMTIEDDTPIDPKIFIDRGFRPKETSFIMEVK